MKYSFLPNKRRVWNNSIGWTFVIKFINVGYSINVLAGFFLKFNYHRVLNSSYKIKKNFSKNLTLHMLNDSNYENEGQTVLISRIFQYSIRIADVTTDLG